ncbi:MAG: hypothetical protein J0L60_01825 [Ignavibacteria bacterium]|nr:hypothetical protein [Ignavibacteria bacterium]
MSAIKPQTAHNSVVYRSVRLDPKIDRPDTGDNYYINTRLRDQFASDADSVKRFRYIAIFGDYLRQIINDDNLEQRKLSKNIQKLVEFQNLKEDWDDDGALPIPQQLIFEVFDILKDAKLLKQPFLSPLATGGILLSFTSWKNNTMDVFITLERYIAIITSTKKGKKNFKEIESDRSKIFETINFFYANY